jgi:hypothetical protein
MGQIWARPGQACAYINYIIFSIYLKHILKHQSNEFMFDHDHPDAPCMEYLPTFEPFLGEM